MQNNWDGTEATPEEVESEVMATTGEAGAHQG